MLQLLIFSLQGTFQFVGTEFHLNGQKFQMISGEMHPPRIPYQYWEHRIAMAKAMGVNTIAFYGFWNVHELKNGSFDYSTQQNNLSHFLTLVKEAGLYSFARPGPYVCAEFEFGGLPVRLLKKENLKVRTSHDEDYLQGSINYIKAVSQVMLPFMIYNDGPILFVQLENEYSDKDTQYIQLLQKAFLDSGITGPFSVCHNAMSLNNESRVPGTAIGVNEHHPSQVDFDIATKLDPNVPIFVSELWTGWFVGWGEKNYFDKVASNCTSDIRFYLENGYSFNFYVIHGGTNFGTTAGGGGQVYSPDLQVTSYDYGAPIDEMGRASYFYHEYRAIIQEFTDHELPAIPASIPVIQITNISMSRVSSIWDQRMIVEQVDNPKYFEAFDQNQGYIVYETVLPDVDSSKEVSILQFDRINGFSQVYVDGKLAAQLNSLQFKGPPSVEIRNSGAKGRRLQVLVEGHCHRGAWQMVSDRMGIYGAPVTMDGVAIQNWTMSRIPLDNVAPEALVYEDKNQDKLGGIFSGSFNLTELGDTFFDFSGYSKGTVFVNGFNIGKFWNIGPQFRLYCPGVWLRQGVNELVIVEMEVQKAAPLHSFKDYK